MSATNGRSFEFELPVGYEDEEGVLHHAAEIHKMTGRDEAIMSDKRNRHNGARMITELLANCLDRLGGIKKPGIDIVRKLYSVDRHFLLIKLREITFGEVIEATYKCPTCSSSTVVIEDLESLEVRALPDGERPDDIAVELQDGYQAPDGSVHASMRFRLSIGSDEERIAAAARQNASKGKNALLARCVTQVGDLDTRKLQALGTAIFNDLTLGDRATIDRALNDDAPGMDMRRNVTCESCGRDFNANLDMSNFLAPSSVETAA